MTDATVNRRETTVDHPDVIIFPPVIPLSTLAIACALQWLAPLGLIAGMDPVWRFGLGTIVVIAGLLTILAGRRALLRNGTNVNPLWPTTALVTEGVFERTRNPLYVGVSAALCGIAVIFALDWVLLLIFRASQFCTLPSSGAKSSISSESSATRTSATRSASRATFWTSQCRAWPCARPTRFRFAKRP